MQIIGGWPDEGILGKFKGMTLDEVLDKLYNSEINWHISSFWDNGFDVKLGDEMNGFDAETNVATSTEAAAWLDEQARKWYQRSKYATRKDPPSESENGDPQR